MKSFLKHLREVFFFSLPVVAGEISHVLFGVGDVIVAGRYSTLVLAAMGIASAFLFPYMVFGLGVMSVVSPLKAQRIGAGDCVRNIPVTSFLLAVSVGVVLTIMQLATSKFIIPLLNYDLKLQELTQQYLYICSFSITPALVFASIQGNLLARSRVVVPNLIIFFFNFINVAANYLLMIKLDMGIAGAAIATLFSRLAMALVIYLYSRKILVWQWSFCRETFGRTFKLGAPAGGSMLVVALVFAVVAMLVGKMSVVAAATNNVLINITSFTFMIPMAISNVTAVKVGHVYGKGNLKAIVSYSSASISLAFVISCVGAVIFFFFPASVISIFTDQQTVVTYGCGMLLFVAFYQLPDALQAVLCGALRGIGETTRPLFYGFISVWLIGLPAGCYLAYSREMEAAGLWAGLAIGLTCLGLMLAVEFFRSIRRIKGSLV